MLETLQIRGVGANEKLNVEFGPYVTSIWGKNFIGKSWFIRALRLVCLNQPSGTSFINWDSDKAKVRLSIDGKRVLRIRSKNINQYKLSGVEKPYSAFGQNTVPRDIAEIINLSDLNFQKQHEAPFWFQETRGEVSRKLNAIVNLEIIDNTLAGISSKLRKAKVVVELTEKSLDKAIQDQKKLSYIEELDEELKNIEKLGKRHEKFARDCDIIEEKLKLAVKYKLIREKRLKLISEADSVLYEGDRYQKMTDSMEKLSNLIESAKSCQKVLSKKIPSIKPLEDLKNEHEELVKQCERLDSLVSWAKSRRREKCRIEKALQQYRKDLEQISKGRCPVCGKKQTS